MTRSTLAAVLTALICVLAANTQTFADTFLVTLKNTSSGASKAYKIQGSFQATVPGKIVSQNASYPINPDSDRSPWTLLDPDAVLNGNIGPILIQGQSPGSYKIELMIEITDDQGNTGKDQKTVTVTVTQ